MNAKPTTNWNDERYYPSPFGQLPSVTTILGLLAKPGLIPWAAGKAVDRLRPLLEMMKAGMVNISDVDIDVVLAAAKKEHREVKDEAADVGKKVHELVANYYRMMRNGAKADEAINSMQEVVFAQKDPQIINAWAAFKDWDGEFQPTPLHVELPVFSHLKYAGTMDFFGGFRDGKNWVVDWKSATALYDETAMQVSAYAAALMETAPNAERIDGWGCLRLDKITGIPEWRPYSREEISSAYDRFTKLAEYWHLTNDWKIKTRAEKKDAKAKAKGSKKI